MTTRKSFKQACPVSAALDVVGDRWTMLVLRELLGGPARFGELLEGLQGIPRNLLATRLKRLEEDGVVRKSPRGTYVLTALGEGVRPVIESLGFWGTRVGRLADVEHARSVRATTMALNAILTRGRGVQPDAPMVLELDAGTGSIEIVLGPEPRAVVREATGAATRLRTSLEQLAGFLDGGGLRPSDLDVLSGPEEGRRALLDALGA